MTVFEARHAAQGGTTTTAKTGNSAAPRHQGSRTAKANNQGKKTGWPAARWQNEARHLPRGADRRPR
jgi:hypothetical protein